ncbi:hypothetical protein PV328_012091 [Microctonus aethiopoides]|uniref:Uncharacterized protein n=1 Tax=Microctonus aethiopoides TaxID=144406 RepID=A0AA39FH57_9HYME|nr:hypothetical protein PV328_012091 [Microctonus aethiopoides]
MGLVQSRCNETSASGSNDVGIGMRDGLGFKATRYEQQQQQQYCQPTLSMGSLGGLHTRSGSVRSAPRQPMPDSIELERRFTKVLLPSSMQPSDCIKVCIQDVGVRGPAEVLRLSLSKYKI